MSANESRSDIAVIPLFDNPQEIDAALTEWFQQAGRTLNFRNTRDPYAIMVSEFMLQQTTVAAVEPYFERFMKAYPTVTDLARAAENDVLASWAGLGYYRRAHQLHAASRIIAESCDKSFPSDVRELIKLPGVGRYTAGAISSLAFDLPSPILEANTVRVFARLTNTHGEVGERRFSQQLWRIAEILVSHSHSPRLFNTAAMELGALVCRPQPLCEKCPISDYCQAYQAGTPTETPRMPPRKETVNIIMITLVIEDARGWFAVQQIPQHEWHAGMWQFPSIKTEIPDAGAVPSFALDQLGIPVTNIQKLSGLRYQVTNHKITCHVFHCYLDSTAHKTNLESRHVQFMSPGKLLKLPMGSAQNKLRTTVIRMKAKDHNAN